MVSILLDKTVYADSLKLFVMFCLVLALDLLLTFDSRIFFKKIEFFFFNDCYLQLQTIVRFIFNICIWPDSIIAQKFLMALSCCCCIALTFCNSLFCTYVWVGTASFICLVLRQVSFSTSVLLFSGSLIRLSICLLTFLFICLLFFLVCVFFIDFF